MKNFVRIVSIMLCIMLCSSVALAVTDDNLNEPGTFPVCKDTVHFTIGIPKSATILDWDTNYMTLSLEEDMNCTFEFVEMGADDGEMKQKVDLMVNAGEKLPDILIYTPGSTVANYYGSLGVFISLNDYMEDAYYLPKALESIPYDANLYAAAPDGNLYGLYAIEYAMETAIYIRLYTNMDFVEAAGLELPTSCQEFEDLLRYIKENDVNGNGDPDDEIPFLTSKTRLWNHFVMPLMTPFVYSVGADGNNYLSFDEDGNIQASYATEGWRSGLRWIRSMVEEGLISPMCFTFTDEDVKAFANSGANGEQMIGVSTYYPVNWYPTGDERAVNWACMRCLEGFDGTRTAPYAIRTPSLKYFVTKYCENPEAAFRLGDLLTGEKYTMMTRYGEYGVDYIDASEDDVSYFEGYEAKYIPILAWAIPNNKRWDNGSPYIRNAVISNGVAIKGKLTGLDAWANEMASECLQYVDLSKVVGMIVYNDAELEVVNEIQSNLATYYKESFSRFCTGDLDLDADWDAYLAELENIGLSTYIEISQKAYDRMHG